jgi:hypothetical protein
MGCRSDYARREAGSRPCTGPVAARKGNSSRRDETICRCAWRCPRTRPRAGRLPTDSGVEPGRSRPSRRMTRAAQHLPNVTPEGSPAAPGRCLTAAPLIARLHQENLRQQGKFSRCELRLAETYCDGLVEPSARQTTGSLTVRQHGWRRACHTATLRAINLSLLSTEAPPP